MKHKTIILDNKYFCLNIKQYQIKYKYTIKLYHYAIY